MVFIRRVISKLIHLFYERKAKTFPIQGKILMFHNVGSEQYSDFNISTSDFESFLKRMTVSRIIRLENWNNCDDFYAISIDDVPEEFYHNAFPLLKKYKIPFTIFVSTSLLDTDGFISTRQLLEITACDLCTIGSHGVVHDEYALLTRKEKRKELSESRLQLSQLIGKQVEIYAFPYGSLFACGYKHKHYVKDYYKFGFGTIQIPITKPTILPDYFLPRINVTTSNIAKL